MVPPSLREVGRDGTCAASSALWQRRAGHDRLRHHLPVLPFYTERLALGAGTPRERVALHVGLLTAAYSLAQLAFAPLWGRLSDRIGRRPLIWIGLGGFAVGQILFGLAGSMAMLYGARGLGGALSSATLPSAAAYVADETSEVERLRGMAWLDSAVGAGIVIGPALGGLLARTGIHLSLGRWHLGLRTTPVDVLLGRERVRRSQVIKQTDVVLLIHLLWDRFPAEIRERNFRYYEPRSGHGSSLSPPIHALVAARLGDIALAERYFQQTAEIDLANNMGNAAGGVHAAALGGLWQALIFGFAGMEIAPEGPRFRPRLPPSWHSLTFEVTWRGRRIPVELGGGARPATPAPLQGAPA